MDVYADGATLMLVGDFDVRSTMEVRAAIYEHVERNSEDVLIDLTHVGSVDLTALRVLAVATRAAKSRGRRLRLRGCGPAVRRLLHLSHLVRLVELEREGATV